MAQETAIEGGHSTFYTGCWAGTPEQDSPCCLFRAQPRVFLQVSPHPFPLDTKDLTSPGPKAKVPKATWQYPLAHVSSQAVTSNRCVTVQIQSSTAYQRQ